MSLGGNNELNVPRRHTGRRVLAALGAIALVCGLMVGVAHWQVHTMQTSDVAWSTQLEHEGELVVAAGRAYSFRYSGGFQVTRLSDGKQLATGSRAPAGMLVGEDGHFAVVDRNRLDFFSPDGQKLWERELAPDTINVTVPIAIGAGTITYRDCSPDATDRTCTLRTVDSTGKVLWTTPTTRSPVEAVRHREIQRQEEATDGMGALLQLIPSVPIVERNGRLSQLDQAGKLIGESIEPDHATAVGDLMIESTRSGSTCRYRGVRAGTVAWTSEADCAGVGEISDVLAFRDRIYVGYDRDPNSIMDHPLRMVSVNLEDGSTHAFDRGWSTALAPPEETTIASSDVVVEQRGHTVTGRSPATGQKMWSRSFDEDDLGYADDGGNRRSTLDASDGAISAVSDNGGVWRRLAVGTRSPENLISLFDTLTGESSGRLLQDYPRVVLGLGSGKGTLVVADGQLIGLR